LAFNISNGPEAGYTKKTEARETTAKNLQISIVLWNSLI
jgi:hypothetical protein